MVREYDGMTGDRIDRMMRTAHEGVQIERFKVEAQKNRFLAPVIVPRGSSLFETLLLGRVLMKKQWGRRYDEFKEAYDGGLSEERVRLVLGAPAFIPHELTLRFVDFSANWSPSPGIAIRETYHDHVNRLTALETLFAANQHPRWVEQMDGENVPFAVDGALLLNVRGSQPWAFSPRIWFGDGRVKLCARKIWIQFRTTAIPTIQWYTR
jgi:hypothetical protein